MTNFTIDANMEENRLYSHGNSQETACSLNRYLQQKKEKNFVILKRFQMLKSLPSVTKMSVLTINIYCMEYINQDGIRRIPARGSIIYQ